MQDDSYKFGEWLTLNEKRLVTFCADALLRGTSVHMILGALAETAKATVRDR